MPIELFQTKEKDAFDRALNNLPVHNEPIVEVTQNDDTEILILVLDPNHKDKDSSFKGYTLEATEEDVFKWYWGIEESTNGVIVKEVLNNDIYIQYAEHFRKDWKTAQAC